MRKVGFSALLSGLVLSALLYLIRQTDWFHAELSRGMSDFAELVESSFWAALVLTAFGVFLLLLSLRPSQSLPENDAPAPLIRNWVCPACGQESPETELNCPVCGSPRNRGVVPGWRCPFCGTDNPVTASQCQNCAAPKERPLLTWICESCGRENPETESRCTACQRRRFTVETGLICPICGSSNEPKAEKAEKAAPKAKAPKAEKKEN